MYLFTELKKSEYNEYTSLLRVKPHTAKFKSHNSDGAVMLKLYVWNFFVNKNRLEQSNNIAETV